MAHGMPRLDLLRASEEPTSYRAGFWGLARIGRREPGEVLELALRARLRGGGELVADIARVPIAEPPEPLPGAPLVAIAMATFEPPLDLFRAQVESIRAQTVTDWICVVSDDCSDPARYAELERVLDGDPRFVLSRSDRRRGFYHNFERALELRSGRCEVRRPRRSGRRLGSRQARDAAYARSVTRSSCTATSGSSRPAASGSRRRTGRSAPTTTRTCFRCWWRTASPAQHRCSGASCSTRPCRYRRPSSPSSTTTGSPSPLSRSATSASYLGRSTTTCSTSTRRSGTRRRHAIVRLRDRLSSLRRGRASGCGSGACTTSSMPAGCSSSRRSSSSAAATG